MVNVNAYIQQAISAITAEKEQQVATVKATVMQEKVMPKNAEIDTARDKAVQELQTKLNADITALQEKFATERQAIIDASEKQKTENANTLINAETATIAYQYDTKIAELKKIIGE